MVKESPKNKDLCKIRTITSFVTLGKEKSTWEEAIFKAASFGGDLANEFKAHGYHVQSIRIVTNPFGEYLHTSSYHAVLKDMQALSTVLKSPSMPKIRIRFAIGEAKTEEEIALLPEMIKAFGDICNACVNVSVDELGVVDRDLTLCCAKAVEEIGRITPRGEGNFNFTINYNCKPHIPYFPASYHNSHDENCFALGLETPDLLVEALKSLKEEKNHNLKMQKSYAIMRDALQYHITEILDIANGYAHPYKTNFAGIDTSAAPSKNCASMVDVYKLLGVPFFGAAGTLEASALLTKVFKAQKGCELIGFSGLMLAVVEDQGLADATTRNEFDIRALLQYSAVCGIGLDTVPIEGDTSVEKIAAICADTGTLAYRLNKPLTVRLFPVPNLKAGDMTHFESDDLCNSMVLRVP
ncbi:DUF711 family protein [Sulfurospirillum diekertiae]|uniref:DUF711 family protein n=1 Tax=Sulfurospirillum diekertiae TaxID=1854492 RepID=A0A1Y0HMM5_9BACT|nr:DUF711 family protein [Sulfurospirillum diekertiae]ARU48473.1 hypothetical protein Sdiek1_1309 [Sulfurospirillum diekertiae]ASC93307.1 hypothetical protein Sdiek2_1288 [Sulfurospirillum diekertiae]